MRDAQGNALALYDNAGGTTNWQEQNPYGSSRLGAWKPAMDISAGTAAATWSNTGHKQYELSNHLGNMLAVVTDKRILDGGGDYQPELAHAQDYYAFGSQIAERAVTLGGPEGYRYGYQGQESENEVKGEGNTINFTYRIYDTRIGKFLSVDPINSQYPSNSPYSFQENKLGLGIEFEGLELFPFIHPAGVIAEVYSKKKDPGFWDWAKAYGKAAAGFLPPVVDTYNNAKDYQLNEVDNGMNRGKRYESAIRSGNDPSQVDVQYKFKKTNAAIKLVGTGIEWLGWAMMGVEGSYAGVLKTNFVQKAATTEAEAILNEALRTQGFKTGDKIPSNFKAKYVNNNTEFEVRIHPGDPKYSNKDIYRVARRTSKGEGWEYLDQDGNWHHTSTLKPSSSNYNNVAAKDTHMPKPTKKN